MKNDTTCSLVQDLLPGYIDGITSEKSSEFVQKHLHQCEDCRRVYDAMNGKFSPAELHAQELVQGMIAEKKRVRRCVLLLLIGALLITAVCLLPLPRRIQRTHEVLEWRCGDRAYSVARTVTIDGFYFDYLFKSDRFTGSFVVSGYPMTQKKIWNCVFFDGLGTLWYENSPQPYGLGMLLMQPDGDEFMIAVYEDGSWNGTDGLMLTGPVKSREEAVALTNRLSRKYSKDWLGARAFE